MEIDQKIYKIKGDDGQYPSSKG